MNISYFKKISVVLALLFFVNLYAVEDQRVIDELNSPMPEIPLKQSMGDRAYNDAINSGEYNYVGNSKCRLCHRNF
ncbi:hypothetical protein, partial [Sulfurimonas sp.]|uniref:hypothetical protein n=1 Tax=Sulfurimonas sp. TaxID=2022749 RepID=UPI0025FDB51C